ncbi:MAG: preprotein translocase subunit SecA [Deltaproteobacteria bacterium]|nr:preprotein translocase subunit SecA [Deltaproteobacteria bacterium]
MSLKELFGTSHERKMSSLQPRVDSINLLEPSFRKLSDRELQNKTLEFKERLRKGETLDQILPEAFATVREAGVRTLGMRHFDVQLIGGIVLHEGSIAEMKTGEGKTLVASLPLYLNALVGKGAHLVTVNDYLASRDADWMGKIYNFLGLTVGKIIHGQSDSEKQQSYRCDICYGTNSEFGFDYLRDNMKESIERYVQRELHFAIVDEVDSILIDESRTPLIISGPAEGVVNLYVQVNDVIPFLKRDIDFTVDEKAHNAMLTDRGTGVVEEKLGIENLYDPKNIEWLHHVNTALKAYTLYKRDVNYLIEKGKIVIIDEFTGRKMEGRRWSDGLHQAIETKENVEIEEENQTLATITYQNFFRMYTKLAGMTGTAETEATEFHKIYKLGVHVIPTNKPVIRKDYEDLIYKNEIAKFKAVAADIKDCHERGQPVLVGTISVEKTEVLARILKKYGVPHEVLNAKNHWREADIVAQAGHRGAVTISTNMAGRGTDIHLGGNPDFLARQETDPSDKEAFNAALEKYRIHCAKEKEHVLSAGGLYILGTERHESRRIDNQLRGRAGRQGDPGTSRFYISLEDDLMRIFGGDRLQRMMEWLKMPDDEPIQHRFVSRSIEDSQRRVEAQNFDIRKNLLEYDDVMNNQRQAIYKLRRHVLEGFYAWDDYTEEELKQGKKPKVPEVSGPWTIEKLGKRIRPWVERIIDFFIDLQKKEIATEKGIDWENDESLIPDVEFEKLGMEPTRITHELYRHFGAVVPLEEELVGSSRETVIEKCISVISASLIQQRERILDLVDELLGNILSVHCPEDVHPEDWKMEEMLKDLSKIFNTDLDIPDGTTADPNVYAKILFATLEKEIIRKEDSMGTIQLLFFSRHYYLDEIDSQWIEHLRRMDHLREGIGLRGYAQKDPKLEYKKEGFNLFNEMMTDIKRRVTNRIFEIEIEEEVEELPEYEHKKRDEGVRMNSSGGDGFSTGADGEKPGKSEIRKLLKRVPRNGPCPCGSGKKYKICHMNKDEAAARKGEPPEWLEEA